MRVLITVLAVVSLAAIAAPVRAQTPVPDLESPGAALRIELGKLLSEHVFLAAEAMRVTASGGAAQAAATDALEENSVAIAAAVESVYGADAGSSFGFLWRAHVGHLLDYAVATGSNNEAAKAAALEGLAEHQAAMTSFFTSANPDLEAQPLAAALQRHNAQLVALLDQEPTAAFTTEREAYRHMFDAGDVLAEAFINQFPDRFAESGPAFSPGVSLWLTLGRLLGEHLILSAEAMRTGIGSLPESTAARDAVNANTRDIAAAFESVYGVNAGTVFESLWDSHVQAYFAYIDAVRAGDLASQQTRRDELTDYSGTFGSYMAAINPYLDAEAVSMAISHHTQALIFQVDAYYAGDYPRAYAEVRQAHAHMFDVAKVLATAIVAHHPELFELPDTGSVLDTVRAVPTGSDTTVRLWLWALLVAVAVALALWERPRVRG